jgi:hypothetical protein
MKEHRKENKVLIPGHYFEKLIVSFGQSDINENDYCFQNF